MRPRPADRSFSPCPGRPDRSISDRPAGCRATVVALALDERLRLRNGFVTGITIAPEQAMIPASPSAKDLAGISAAKHKEHRCVEP